MTYVLVMTTNWLKETDAFWIVVLGPNKVILDRLSKCIYVCIVSLENALNLEHSILKYFLTMYP
jgi:hypothetical protein